MKTAKEKAEEVAKNWCHQSGVLSCDGTYFNSLCYCIEKALKEQDRDTRHACAEAVINAKDAHDACMNVKAV